LPPPSVYFSAITRRERAAYLDPIEARRYEGHPEQLHSLDLDQGLALDGA